MLGLCGLVAALATAMSTVPTGEKSPNTRYDDYAYSVRSSGVVVYNDFNVGGSYGKYVSLSGLEA